LDKIVVYGGQPLAGDVSISGAKNAALPILAAALLTARPCTFSNIPDLMDIKTIKKLLASMGVRFSGDRTLEVCAETITSSVAPYDLVKTMRASILVLGPLGHRRLHQIRG